MLDAMTRLRETRQLSSISDDSVTFKDFQGLIESTYFKRRGSGGLARIAAPQAPTPVGPALRAEPRSVTRLHATRFDAEEPRTGSHG